MPVDKISSLGKEWQVPKYKIKFDSTKNHAFCVVIPVINEGSRITNLLSRMKELAVSDIADIIIVDGGSTDGSLEFAGLKSLGVNALIEKTDSGKLSAQLRCAYEYTLNLGYQGIITIDGNDKDDPEAIPRFISALNNGYDFVQASRFIDGGVAENTPAIRDFAIRFLHAPILSIFSGFKWTDTTQGFRAYSCKMLLDPCISPFRTVFSTYELLAYLSYRAPKLGYKCIEIATSRKYPSSGHVPTKISSFRGNISVFVILIKACLGHYNPKT
jgi:dolichol-phosphate mannosyltransferase